MVILLQNNKTTFEKSENQDKKIHISHNLVKILTENCFFFKFFSWFFLNFPGGNSIKKKSRQIALPNLDYISNTIS